MGGNESKQEKSIDSTGEVNNNNNVIVSNEVSIVISEIVTLLAVLVALQLFQLCLYVYAQYTKKLKKRYSSSAPNVSRAI